MALTLHQSGHGHSHGGLDSKGHGHSHEKTERSNRITNGDVDPEQNMDNKGMVLCKSLSPDCLTWRKSIIDVLSGHRTQQANASVRAAFVHVVGDLLQSISVLISAIIIFFKVCFTCVRLYKKKPQHKTEKSLNWILTKWASTGPLVVHCPMVLVLLRYWLLKKCTQTCWAFFVWYFMWYYISCTFTIFQSGFVFIV